MDDARGTTQVALLVARTDRLARAKAVYSGDGVTQTGPAESARVGGRGSSKYVGSFGHVRKKETGCQSVLHTS